MYNYIHTRFKISQVWFSQARQQQRPSICDRQIASYPLPQADPVRTCSSGGPASWVGKPKWVCGPLAPPARVVGWWVSHFFKTRVFLELHVCCVFGFGVYVSVYSLFWRYPINFWILLNMYTSIFVWVFMDTFSRPHNCFGFIVLKLLNKLAQHQYFKVPFLVCSYRGNYF